MVGSLEPLRGIQLLTDQAYQSLKTAILNLTLAPGEPIVETAVAQRLGVSKTPVRDALRRLEKEGLVVFYPYKGFYVAPISREDICEVYQLRGLLEGMAARIAAESLTKEQFEVVENLLNQAEQALNRGDERACGELSKEFHRFVVRTVKNRRLEAVLDNLSDHEERFYNLVFGIPGRLRRSVDEHWQVYRALVERDGLKAEAAVHEHVNSFLKEFLADERVRRVTEP